LNLVNHFLSTFRHLDAELLHESGDHVFPGLACTTAGILLCLLHESGDHIFPGHACTTAGILLCLGSLNLVNHFFSTFRHLDAKFLHESGDHIFPGLACTTAGILLCLGIIFGFFLFAFRHFNTKSVHESRSHLFPIIACTTSLSLFPKRLESLFAGLVFVENGDHYSRCSSCFSYLQERIWVFLSLFTPLAEVEIRSNTALVAVAYDGTDPASIALDAVMDNWAFCIF